MQGKLKQNDKKKETVKKLWKYSIIYVNIIEILFLYLLNYFLMPLTNQTRKEKIILYTSPPLSNRVKKYVLNLLNFFFSTLGLIASIKNIKQNIPRKYCILVFVLRNQN